MKPTPYQHPGNKRLQFWDLPGVGTPEFPRHSYMEKIEFEKYDFHIVVSCGRFTEDDLWFARTIQEQRPNVPVYFVRTKLDIDIASSRRRKGNKSRSSTDIVDEIKEVCVSYMDRNNIKKSNVFVVSNVLSEQVGEMEQLIDRLVSDAVGLKKEALLLTLTSYSKEMIAQKKELLQGKVKAMALSSGAVACVPLPGASEAADVAIFLGMAHRCTNVFGLDDKSLGLIAKLHSIPDEVLKARLELESSNLATTVGVIAFIGKYAVSKTSGAIAKYLLPGAGSLISGAMSYYTTGKALEGMIEIFANDASKVYDFTRRGYW